jgi:hypothetical protein
MHSNLAGVMKLVSIAALAVAVIGGSFVLYEAATFPRFVQGERRTAINLGRRLPVYGTEREFALNHVSFVMMVSGVIIGVFAAAIGKGNSPTPGGSNQLPDPTSPSVTPPAKTGGAPSVGADH